MRAPRPIHAPVTRAAHHAPLRRGADPNSSENIHDAPPLHWAVEKEDPELVQQLLNAGADPNRGIEDGSSPADYAAVWADSPEVRRRLLLARRAALPDNENT